MISKTIGFIGGGNMASAIMGGVIKAGLVDRKNIIASDKNADAVARLTDQLGVNASTDNKATAQAADILFFAVKPNVLAKAVEDVRDIVKADTIIVSIAAGKSIATIENLFGRHIKLVRVMPNTPALVGASMSALCPNENITDNELTTVKDIFESLGEAEVVPESMMDVVTGVSGSSPAYVYMFIEAMADAAVADGMPRAQAYKFAAQAVMGSAKMVLETGKHPGELKDAVCSPGGTTIEAVAILEEMGFRSAVIEATRGCTAKSKEMSQA